MEVMIGVDPHKGSHTAAMLDRAERGCVVGGAESSFPLQALDSPMSTMTRSSRRYAAGAAATHDAERDGIVGSWMCASNLPSVPAWRRRRARSSLRFVGVEVESSVRPLFECLL